MNDLKQGKKSKVLALFMALLLAFQLLPMGTAFAEGAGDKLPDAQVVVHPRNYTPADQASFINITKGGTTYTPVDGVYQNIPAGAKIEFQIGFSLVDGIDGNENDPFDYLSGQYFMVDLPSGLDFSVTSGDVLASDGTKFAVWSIDPSTNKLTVTLTEGAEHMGYGKQGVFGFNGEFQYLKDEDDTAKETEINFGGDIVKITRKPFNEDHPPVAKGSVSKTGSYNAAANKIIWTVEVTPPAGGSLEGYALVDVLTGNHTYAGDDTFKVGGATRTPTVSGDKKTIGYTFATASGDTNLDQKQTVTYTTTPDAGTLGGKTFTNTAHLEKSTEVASNEATATTSTAGFFDKAAGSAVKDPVTGETYVPWTVTVKLPATDGVYTLPNAKIIDTIATDTGYAKHEFVNTATYPVKIQLPGQSAVAVNNDVATGNYSVTNGVMTYTFPSGHPKTNTTVQTYVLTYYTHVSEWKTDYQTNNEVSVKNMADFQWGGDGGPGTGWSIGNVGISKDVIPSGGLLTKSVISSDSDYGYQNNPKYIQWSIDIDKNKVDLAVAAGGKILLTDTLPAGLDLVVDATHELILTDGTTPKKYQSAVANEFTFTSSGFTLDLLAATGGTKIDKPYTVTFWSVVNSTGIKEFYKANNNKNNGSGTVSFTNWAELECSVPNLKVSATKTFNSQMMNKVVGSYDYSTRLAKWTVEVNKNALEIGGATISDTLPNGLKLYIDGMHPFNVTGGTVVSNSAVDGGTGFEIVLPASTTSTYTITYWTKVQDDALVKDGNKSFPNTAKLTLADKTEFSSSSTLTIKNEVITKSTDYKASDGDTITWSVKINPAQIDLKDASVKDDLIAALAYVVGSAKLFEATVAQNGNLTKTTPGTPVSGGYSVTVSGQTVTIKLPDGPKAYILEFDTVITQDSADIINSINFSGNSQTNAGTSTANKIVIKNLYSNGTSGSTSFVIKKVDESGKPMPGVTFKLLNASKQPFKYTTGKGGAGNQQTTNLNGEITFTDLPDWVLYVQEVNPPQGYLLAPISGGVRPSQTLADEPGVNIKIANVIGKAKVEITKEGANHIGLSGGKFTLTGTSSYNNQAFTLTDVPAENGKVTFDNVPIGNYTITETEAPTGHKISGTTIAVAVNYNSDKTGTVVTYGGQPSYTLPNTPIPTAVTFKKTDLKANGLAGGTFVLKKGGAEVASATADSGGMITFSNLSIGNYEIYETAAPNGYLLPAVAAKILDVAVSYNSGNTGLDAAITKVRDTGEYGMDGSTLTYKNVPAVAKVEITKEGANSILLSGGKFKLTGTSSYNNHTFTLVDVAAVSGKVTFNNVPVGNYTITETEAPTGHQISSASIAVVVSYNSDKTGTVVTYDGGPTGKLINEPTAADATRVSFKKTDLAGNAISGGSFLLSGKDYKNNDVSKTVAAAADGTVSFDGITIGTYIIKEVTPPGGYLRPADETILNVTVAYNGNHTGLDVTITGAGENADSYEVGTNAFKNAPALTAVVEFTKLSSADPGMKVNGGTFEIRGMADTGKEFAATASAVDGTVTFSNVPANRNGQTYTIKELTPPSGYFSTDKTLTVTVSYNADHTAVLAPVFASDDFLTNDLIPYSPGEGKATVTKVDEDGKVLAGATFTLYDSKGTAVASMTTGADGLATFTKLKPYSSYTIKETVAPTGYKLSDEVLTVTTKDRSTLTFTMVNKLLDKPTEPTKPTDPTEPTDPTDPSNPTNPGGGTTEAQGKLGVLKVNSKNVRLAGAEFTIYDVSGKPYASAVTGADGIVWFTDLPLGVYAVAETRAPEGYLTFEGTQGFELTAATPELAFTLRNAAEGEDAEVAGWEDDMVPLGAASDGNGQGNLPQTGEIPTSFYLLLAGLSLLGAGFITALPRKKGGKRIEKK